MFLGGRGSVFVDPSSPSNPSSPAPLLSCSPITKDCWSMSPMYVLDAMGVRDRGIPQCMWGGVMSFLCLRRWGGVGTLQHSVRDALELCGLHHLSPDDTASDCACGAWACADRHGPRTPPQGLCARAQPWQGHGCHRSSARWSRDRGHVSPIPREALTRGEGTGTGIRICRGPKAAGPGV